MGAPETDSRGGAPHAGTNAQEYVEMEERAALAARFGHDQVVERQVVRNDQVLFDVPARTRRAAEAPINTLLIATPMFEPYQ